MNPAVQAVTRDLIDAALERVERGQTTIADANAIRAYLLMLESRLAVYELGDDSEDHG